MVIWPVRIAAAVRAISSATADGTSFDEALLFTHRGLSGPAVLQASSYWQEKEDIRIDLLPQGDVLSDLKHKRQSAGRRNLTTELAQYLPTRLVEHLTEPLAISGNLADQSDARLAQLVGALKDWSLQPAGTEGYRTAEVTLGGVDTDGLSAKTLQAKAVPGLFFIGEAVDVTGWLGGYNFQWAWSSAMAAARSL